MRSYLDFEKPVAELEAKIEELRAIQAGGNGVAIGEEIVRLEAKALQALEDLYAELTPWQKTQVARDPRRPHCLDYVNALITDNGFSLPHKDAATDILRPGVVGNVIIGTATAGVSWCLYGPLSTAPFGGGQAYSLSPSNLAAFFLYGIGGAQVLTTEIDKRALRSAANQLVVRVLELTGAPKPRNLERIAPFDFADRVNRLVKSSP